MFGNAFADALKAFKAYIIKYGEEPVIPYISTLLWDEKKDESIVASTVQVRIGQEDDPFVSGIQDMYEVELLEEKKLPANGRKAYIADFFDSLFRNKININTPGDSRLLHVYFYVPLYDPKVWKQVQEIIAVLKELSVSFHIDIIGLASDLAFLFTGEETKDSLPERKAEYAKITSETIASIVDYKSKNPTDIAHLVVLQDCQRDGLALQLDQEAFTRIIGEYAFLCAEHYYDLFLNITSQEYEISALGLAVLYFDKYYFVQYLLKRTYIHIMERERVTETKVDVSKAAQISQEKLEDKTKLLSDFFQKEIKPLLIQKMDHKKIIPEITPKIDALIDEISDDLQSFLSDPTLSLPEKRATLATLLGMDDTLLTGYEFNRDQLILDDLYWETAKVFIEANNDILTSENKELAVLSPHEKAYLPLKEIKRVRWEIRQATTYIREKEEQLSQIKKQKDSADESDKRLTEDGYFVYEGNRFKLLPKNITEIPLTDTYKPSEVKVSSVDLRMNFSHIKNQGSQGSCSAFALSSIYEYILKINNALDADLSESFLYYNARKKSGKEASDCGSNFFDTISALSESGICTEDVFPYVDSEYDIEPPEEAYADGLKRLVKKARNVDVSVNDFRSALANGYPIAISLKIFDSFSQQTAGFIPRPSESEILSGNSGFHAMVICGFSDDKKVFIVRNSWGESFGENGYCYIPYSYIGDPALMNMACIITETGSNYQITGKKKVQAFFDTTDANIQYAIIKNLIGEEQYRLQGLIKKDKLYRQIYYTIIERLRNNSVRNQLIDGIELHLEGEAENYKKQQENVRNEKGGILKTFRNHTNKIMIRLVGVVLGIWILLGALIYYFTVSDILTTYEAWYAIVASFIIIALLFIYYPYRKKKERLLKEDLENEIIQLGVWAEECLKEASRTRLRLHIAGMFLDRFFNLDDRLKNKYNVMQSFTGNLLTWNKELQEEVGEMNAVSKDPFIPLLSNQVLDNYFENHKQNIAKELFLSDFIKGYEVSEEGITTFKKKMKQSVVNSILSLTKDFKVFSHISQDRQYPYLDETYANYRKLLPLLNQKSKIFLQLSADGVHEAPHKIVFIKTDGQGEKDRWNKTYPGLFDISPTSVNLNSPNKIIVARIMGLKIPHVLIAHKI